MFKWISVEDLEIGMYVVGLDTPWFYTPFLIHRFLIKSQSHIDKLKSHGIRVVQIDTSKGRDQANDPPAEGKEESFIDLIQEQSRSFAQQTAPVKVPYDEEIAAGKRIYREVKKTLETVVSQVRLRQKLQLEELFQANEMLINSLLRNRNALLSLARLKSYDEYTFFHCVNVAILALSMGVAMGYPRSDLQILGVGALLHDIGKTMIPDRILNKPGRLSETEFEIIKRHVEFGLSLLAEVSNLPADVRPMVGEHHERNDGSGYPKGLQGEEINDFAGIAGVVDVFDALTTKRVYKHAIHPQEALREMYKIRHTFKKGLLEHFIQTIGIFPIGSLVELDTKEIALVIENNLSDLLRPKVKLLFDRKGYRHTRPRTLDLTEKNPQRTAYLNEICRVVEPEACGLDSNRYIELVTFN